MSDSGSGGWQPPERVPVRLDARRHQQLREMVEYIITISFHAIEPDRYRWDAGFLEKLSGMLSVEDWREMTLLVSHRDALMIETLADAAGTFTHRGDEPLMDGVSGDDCWEFIRWFGQATRALYGPSQPPG
jgi:hypothetical protein